MLEYFSNTIPDYIVMSRPYSSIWSVIYHESIVEHDPRLRSICTQTPWINFEEIIDVDRLAAKCGDRIESHPIDIYLNRLAPKSSKIKNNNLIYKRHEMVASSTIDYNYDGKFRDRDTEGMRSFYCSSKMTINLRNRWIKLYERNPVLPYTTSALSTQLYRTIQAQSRLFDESAPAETMVRSFFNYLDKYPKCSKVRIYHRQTWNHLEEGGSFPSIWKEPDPSAWLDDVSGVALCHITLLCRDMICECNNCTTGCPVGHVSRCCDVCRLEKFNIKTSYGSFGEGCMLPTFFVQNQLNEKIRKCSDIDIMHNSGRRIGFNTYIESNIFATIESDNCRPGYLRLRVAGNGKIFRLSNNMEFLDDNNPLRIRSRNIEDAFTYLFKENFTNGPATTRLSYGDTPNFDTVYYFSCSSWPPIAQTWVDRERRSKWPSKEIIREIVSKGCRIVHKPHPSSRDPDAEFRFSFSVAELILFNTLSVDQKKCFIAFKALVKYGVCQSEFKTKNEINLSTYHLKTIFFWSCETIPADQWQDTNTDGQDVFST